MTLENRLSTKEESVALCRFLVVMKVDSTPAVAGSTQSPSACAGEVAGSVLLPKSTQEVESTNGAEIGMSRITRVVLPKPLERGMF